MSREPSAGAVEPVEPAEPIEPAESQPSLDLEDQLCFTLYAASRAVTSRYRPLLDALQLTYPQYLVLLVLWQHQAVPVRKLGAALQLDYGTLTPLVKRLEANGLVRRERQADDERVVEVTLTEQGEALRERARTVPPVIGDAMGLSPEEVATMQNLLRRLTANVARSAQSPQAARVARSAQAVQGATSPAASSK